VARKDLAWWVGDGIDTFVDSIDKDSIDNNQLVVGFEGIEALSPGKVL
jgi:hypothetical protein